jgi:branched-chain amino acid transport system permease protein
LLRGVAAIVFDKQFHKLPGFTGEAPIDILGAAVQPQSFWVLGGTAVVVVVLYVFLEHTLLGKAVLATAANRLAARLVGINTTTIMALAFGGSAAIGTTMLVRCWL